MATTKASSKPRQQETKRPRRSRKALPLTLDRIISIDDGWPDELEFADVATDDDPFYALSGEHDLFTIYASTFITMIGDDIEIPSILLCSVITAAFEEFGTEYSHLSLLLLHNHQSSGLAPAALAAIEGKNRLTLRRAIQLVPSLSEQAAREQVLAAVLDLQSYSYSVCIEANECVSDEWVANAKSTPQHGLDSQVHSDWVETLERFAKGATAISTIASVFGLSGS